MNPKSDKQVEEYSLKLAGLGIENSVLKHTESKNIDEVLVSLGLNRSDSAATLIMKADDTFVAIIRRDDCKLDVNKVKNILKVDKLKIATDEEFINVTGLTPGAAIYFPDGVTKILIDKKVLEKEYIVGGSGSFSSSVRHKTADLYKIPKSELVEVAFIQEEINLKQLGGKRILSGITPSGNALHIGNYFGAVKPQIELQNRDMEVYYFVADLHALTTIKDREKLEYNITNVVLDYLALGLDPEKCVFFRQSQVPEHSQLAIVLANYISYGQMQRMHAFKDKLQVGSETESINMGLFNYPILMAADILLYKPYGVPVGEDQRQHIELARDIAENFNKTYSKNLFPLPQPLISKETGKVIGTDGNRKMSKSLGNIIGIFDDYEIIKKQIMSAYTDPNRKKVTDPGKIEGNTVFIYHDLINRDKELVEKMKTRYMAGDIGDVEVKERLLEAHKSYFAEARERRKALQSNIGMVKNILSEGSKKASVLASKTLSEVYKLTGISNKFN